jgi:hypothetical protein
MALQAQGTFCTGNGIVDLRRHIGFYEYYQIGKADDIDPSESGPKDQGELTQTGMHSPWGMLFQIVKETGWSWHDVLWKTSRANIMLMMADRSHFKMIKEEDKVIKDDGKGLMGRIKSKRQAP